MRESTPPAPDLRSPIGIAVIEDNRLLREGLTTLLNRFRDLRVVAQSSRADMFTLQRLKPEVVLLDLGLRAGHSLQTAVKVKKELPDTRVIVMDLLPMHEDIVEYVNAGVSGFIMKDATLDDLANTIRSVAAGSSVLPQQIVGTLFTQIAREATSQGTRTAQSAVRMTPREREVINLIAEGLGNAEISGRLRVASHTVKSHVRNIMEKLTLHTRLQIAAYAYKDDAVREPETHLRVEDAPSSL